MSHQNKFLSTKKISSFIKQQQSLKDPFKYDFKQSNKLKAQMQRQIKTLGNLYEQNKNNQQLSDDIRQSMEYLFTLQQKFQLQRIKKQIQIQQIKYEKNQLPEEQLNEIIGNLKEKYNRETDQEFDDSEKARNFSEEIENDNFLSLQEKNKYISAIWQKYKKVQPQLGSRSSNNNNYKIDEYIDQQKAVYIPSQGNCFFKCLEFFIKSKICPNLQQKYIDILIDLKQNKYQNQFKQGISSKACCKILNEYFYDQQIKYINFNQYKQQFVDSYGTFYILSYNNHYCLVIYSQQQTCEQQQNIIKQKLSQNFIEQNMNTISQQDIDQMICFTEYQKQKQQEKNNEKIQEKECYIFISDIESYQEKDQLQVPYMNGFISRKITFDQQSQQITEKINNKQCKINFDENPKQLMNQMIDQMFKLMKKDKISKSFLIFHNGKRYDNIILLQYLDSKKYDITKIIKKGCSIQFTIKYQQMYIQLFDSTDLMKASLKNIGKDFKLINQKIQCDEIAHIQSYQQFIENKIKIIEYFIMDLASLFEFFINFRNSALQLFQLDLLNYQTIGQLSITKYIQSFNPQYRNQQWFFNNIQQNNFLRQFYRGGRTCAFRRTSKPGEKLYYVDANSLYPSSMLQLEEKLNNKIFILDNKAIALQDQQLQQLMDKYNNFNQQQFDYIQEAYLITCHVYIPCQKNVIVNNIRYEQDGQQKSGYVTGEFTQTHWFSWDLIQSIKYNNLKILKIHQAIQFTTQSESNLSVYIKDLYQKRNEQKKQGNESNQLFLKCIMNALYGKTVQKPIYDKIKPMTNETKKIYQRYDVQKLLKYQDFTFFQYQDNTLKSQMNCSNISYAYQILSMSKIIMNNMMEQCDCIIFNQQNNGKNLCYYTDTDSIIIQEYQFNILKQKGLIGNDMGQAKLEHIITDYFSAGKKMYTYKTEENINKYILKGISGQSDEQYQYIFNGLKENKIISTQFTQFLIKLGKIPGITVNNEMQKIIKNTYSNDKYLDKNFYHSLHISSSNEVNHTI